MPAQDPEELLARLAQAHESRPVGHVDLMGELSKAHQFVAPKPAEQRHIPQQLEPLVRGHHSTFVRRVRRSDARGRGAGYCPGARYLGDSLIAASTCLGVRSLTVEFETAPLAPTARAQAAAASSSGKSTTT